MSFFTADLCDAHFEKVRVLNPTFQSYGGKEKIRGTIVTVKLDKNNHDLAQILRDEEGNGRIIVVDVSQEYYAVVGENLIKFALQKNWAGIVVNGYVRDTDQTSKFPVGLFAIGTCPRKYIPQTQGVRGIELSFEGVIFKDGDYLYADNDGIILCDEKIV
ncbi:MAG: ribonuclease E activity regulator RraA [Candidatus Marinarcus sp.]|uniref:ribonuclease E activity regulator RraA n=1 Tax=Candidatus Marinarcus sp. TaxID=3100987 RepID=UPI003B003C77